MFCRLAHPAVGTLNDPVGFDLGKGNLPGGLIFCIKNVSHFRHGISDGDQLVLRGLRKST